MSSAIRKRARIRYFPSPQTTVIRGHYAGVQPSFPSPAGFEGVGIIDALGPQVQGFTCGQRVAAINAEKGGNWAEYAVLPSHVLIPVPDDISDEQVASFLINPATAILMLRHVLAIPQGEWLLQSAAGSELGRMIIKLAKHDGIRTINVVRRRESVAELEQLGADAVIVSTEGPIDKQIYQALSDYGRMLVYGSLTGEPIRLGADPRFILAGHRILEVCWLGYWFPRLEDAAKQDLIDEIIALMREGVLMTSAVLKFSLDEIDAAVRQAESKGRRGKVLLVPTKKG